MTRARRTGPVLAKGEERKGKKKTPNYVPGTVSPLFLVSHSGERTLSASPYRYKTRRNTIYPIQYCNAASLPASSVMFSICLPCYSGRRPKFDAFSGADPRFLLSLSLSLSLFSHPPLVASSPRFRFKLVRECTYGRKTREAKKMEKEGNGGTGATAGDESLHRFRRSEPPLKRKRKEGGKKKKKKKGGIGKRRYAQIR